MIATCEPRNALPRAMSVVSAGLTPPPPPRPAHRAHKRYAARARRVR
jgi:hypothetical protein